MRLAAWVRGAPAFLSVPNVCLTVFLTATALRKPATERSTERAASRMVAPGTDVCWEDKVWMQHFPLNRETVLDYFSHSPVSQPLHCGAPLVA